ncbi:hypothetical protein F5I97DRAFT_25983 [Phlebopus sp. FC_14]|nr:hypothetical protein F5I97DRAFT_25983 [Phlebopus sp. FC_14]
MPNFTFTTSDWDRDQEPHVESSGAHHVKHTPLRSNPEAREEGSSTRIVTSASAPSQLPSNDGSTPSSPVFSTIPSPVSSPHSSPIVPPITFPSLNPLPLDMRDDTVNGAGPSTPILSRGPTPSSQTSGQASSQGSSQTGTQVSAQTQLASMRGAMEAARLREEKSRAEAERVSKEYEELRWRWNEDAGAWRRREAELQAQIHHLMQQLHAYAAVLSSFQSQHAAGPPSTSFPSPTSPSPNMRPHSSPRLQHPAAPFPLSVSSQFQQNPAGAPVHVQAMLASAPMLTSRHQGFVGGFNGMNTAMGVASMSPLLWSGLGFAGSSRNGNGNAVGQHTPDSSASSSPSRGRRRSRQADDVRSASDDSSLGDWDGADESLGGLAEDANQEQDGCVEEEDDIFRNNVLADAILKRPESLRGLSGSGKRIGSSRVPSRTSVVSDGNVASFFNTPKGKEHEGTITGREEIVIASSGSGADVVEQPGLEEPTVTVTIANAGDEDASVSTPLGDTRLPNSSGHQ